MSGRFLLELAATLSLFVDQLGSRSSNGTSVNERRFQSQERMCRGGSMGGASPPPFSDPKIGYLCPLFLPSATKDFCCFLYTRARSLWIAFERATALWHCCVCFEIRRCGLKIAGQFWNLYCSMSCQACPKILRLDPWWSIILFFSQHFQIGGLGLVCDNFGNYRIFCQAQATVVRSRCIVSSNAPILKWTQHYSFFLTVTAPLFYHAIVYGHGASRTWPCCGRSEITHC